MANIQKNVEDSTQSLNISNNSHVFDPWLPKSETFSFVNEPQILNQNIPTSTANISPLSIINRVNQSIQQKIEVQGYKDSYQQSQIQNQDHAYIFDSFLSEKCQTNFHNEQSIITGDGEERGKYRKQIEDQQIEEQSLNQQQVSDIMPGYKHLMEYDNHFGHQIAKMRVLGAQAIRIHDQNISQLSQTQLSISRSCHSQEYFNKLQPLPSADYLQAQIDSLNQILGYFRCPSISD